MSDKTITGAKFEDTGYSYTLSLINGKYKPIILYCLMEYEPVRFNEMQRYLGRVADKPEPQGTGKGRPDPPAHVPGGSAPGGVPADGAGPLPGGGAGQALRLGHGEPAQREREINSKNAPPEAEQKPRECTFFIAAFPDTAARRSRSCGRRGRPGCSPAPPPGGAAPPGAAPGSPPMPRSRGPVRGMPV